MSLRSDMGGPCALPLFTVTPWTSHPPDPTCAFPSSVHLGSLEAHSILKTFHLHPNRYQVKKSNATLKEEGGRRTNRWYGARDLL